MEAKTESPSQQLNKREAEILARLSRGLSDQQIADELFLSLSTIKWYNRQIYVKLGVNSRTQATLHTRVFGLLEGGDRAPTSAPRHNLPTPTAPFIGREIEIAELTQLLNLHRLVTLTGTGGIGKTRLALHLAAEVAEGFSDGVYFVDLAPISDDALVAKAIARALGVMENPSEPLPNTLVRVLAQREMLLVIDNFEHVITAAPLLSVLLSASPRLKVLVTSRESLRLVGEQEYPVPPLSLPAEGVASAQSVSQSEAGALFTQQARMVMPRFTVSADNAPAIAGICARLGGLPLAIELAAGRCKLLTPKRLLERLKATGGESPLHTLAGGWRDAPPRLRTMRASIEWSYDLLDRDEQALFERSSVFRGGWSLEATEAVCGEGLSIDVFDGLASLVDKSLVQQVEPRGGEARFVMLELIHEYARERLEASGEGETLRRRHATYFVETAERAEPELRLAGYDYWCDRFEVEMDNLRAVLEWALGDGDVTLGVRLAGALCLFWYGKGHHVEAIRWSKALLGRLDEVPADYHPRFLVTTGHMAWMYDLDEARRLFAKALDTARTLGDKAQTAWALTFLGYSSMREPQAAMSLTEEGLAVFRSLEHKPGVAQALNMVGEIARVQGDDSRARRAYEDCLAVLRETGEARRTCYIYNSLAYLAEHEGDHQRALYLGREVLLIAQARGDRHEMAQVLMSFAGAVGALGQPQRAARLLASGEVALERMGALSQPSDKPEYERTLAALRAQIGEPALQAALHEGRQIPLEQAMADALEDQA
ncbi:MAG: LuxR C-terminal-related transcriptional regulator [Chloroflexota bacterium]